MLSSLLTKVTDNATLGLPFLLYLLFRFAFFLVEVPTVRMVEHAACHQQLDGGGLSLVSLLTDFDEERCKTAPVQQQVSSIIGWKMCFDAVPATPHFGKLISPPIARALMKANIYIPSLVSSAIILLCILLLRFIRNPREVTPPETGAGNQSTEPLLTQREPAYGATASSDLSAPQRPLPSEESSATPNSGVVDNENETRKLQFLLPLILRRLKSDTFSLHRDSVLNVCYLAFFLKSNAMASEAFVFQYLSERFDWPLRDTTILRFALSFGAVITTLILGPLATLIFTARGVPAPTINLVIIRLSILVLVVCFIAAWRVSSSTAFILCKQQSPMPSYTLRLT
ncbi:hypothetical protein Neosp_007942 [[Neocosmospora] mangrovei]